MGLREVNQEELRLLARMGGAGRWVLSIYLSVDPPRASGPHVRAYGLRRPPDFSVAAAAEIVVVESEALDSLGRIAALLRY